MALSAVSHLWMEQNSSYNKRSTKQNHNFSQCQICAYPWYNKTTYVHEILTHNCRLSSLSAVKAKLHKKCPIFFNSQMRNPDIHTASIGEPWKRDSIQHVLPVHAVLTRCILEVGFDVPGYTSESYILQCAGKEGVKGQSYYNRYMYNTA